MGLYKSWCDKAVDANDDRHFWQFTEKAGGRKAIAGNLAKTMQSHYSRLKNIADDIDALGYKGAATILKTLMPTLSTAQSGELGEILATELVEEQCGFKVPIRRLREKDGRQMALRGDDFIGVQASTPKTLRFLKGEAKSRENLYASVVAEARQALNRDAGRCTPHSLLFVANKLLDSPKARDRNLGRRIRNMVGMKSILPSQVDHMLFTFSQNDPEASLTADLTKTKKGRTQYAVNVQIQGHQKFIEAMYKKAVKLGKP